MLINNQDIQISDIEDFLLRLKRSHLDCCVIEDDPIIRASNLEDTNQFFTDQSQEQLLTMIDDYGLLPLVLSVVGSDHLHLLLHEKPVNIDGVKHYLKTCINHRAWSSIELFQVINSLDGSTSFNTKRQLKQDLYNRFLADVLSRDFSEKTCLISWLFLG